MRMTIKTKRKNMLNNDLVKNKEYTILGIVEGRNFVSGKAVIVEFAEESRLFDAKFFRLNSLKLANN